MRVHRVFCGKEATAQNKICAGFTCSANEILEVVALMLAVCIALNYRCKPIFYRVAEPTTKRSSNSRIKWQGENGCTRLFGKKGSVINAAVINYDARKTDCMNSSNYLSNGRRFVVRRYNDENFTVLNHEGRQFLSFVGQDLR